MRPFSEMTVSMSARIEVDWGTSRGPIIEIRGKLYCENEDALLKVLDCLRNAFPRSFSSSRLLPSDNQKGVHCYITFKISGGRS